jgi:hypothetical protein
MLDPLYDAYHPCSVVSELQPNWQEIPRVAASQLHPRKSNSIKQPISGGAENAGPALKRRNTPPGAAGKSLLLTIFAPKVLVLIEPCQQATHRKAV